MILVTPRLLIFCCVATGLLLRAAPSFADVGIGTETPTAALHVVGESEGAGADVRIENLDPPAAGETFSVVVSDPNGFLHAASLDALADALKDPDPGTGGEPDDDWRPVPEGSDLTIDSAIYTNNRVGVGTTFPAYELDVEGDIRATGSIFASDHVITHATFATSDARFKRDIRPLDNGLALVRALAPKQFRYTDQAPVGRSDRIHYGLIAQDAAEVDANLVEAFELPSSTSNAPTTNYLAVDSQRLVFALISAVQALDRKDREIDQLQTRIEGLEARLDALEQEPTALTLARQSASPNAANRTSTPAATKPTSASALAVPFYLLSTTPRDSL